MPDVRDVRDGRGAIPGDRLLVELHHGTIEVASEGEGQRLSSSCHLINLLNPIWMPNYEGSSMQRPNPETVTLNDILITEELTRRTPRSPNWQAEAEAMRSLGQQMAQASESLMQTLVDTAQELCQAGTTGVSLLETTTDGTEIFRWNALAGTLAHHVGGSTPRNFSPCGVCLEQGSPVLFSYPERYFTYFQEANTPLSAEGNSVEIVEELVLPLIADSHVLGTIWIMSHDEGRQFDSEDVRVMTSLADFTATALLLQRQTRELLVRQAADLIEQRQAEGDLWESEARLQSIANLVPDLLWDSEPNGSTNWYNQRWMEYTGQTFEQAIGWGWTDAIHPDDREGAARCYREAVEQGMPLQQEHRIRRHDGAYRWFVIKVSPLKDERGKVIKMYGTATDIHDRKQVEDALRESEAKYRSLFNSMDEGYAVVEVLADDNGEWNDFLYLEVNPAFEQQTGMVNSVGRKATEILGTPNPAWAKIYGRVAETGEPVRFEENEATLDRIFDLYAFRLGEAGSRRVAVLFTDITERKRVAEALAELDRAKTVFFSNVSHEFRTPLTLLLAPLQDALSDEPRPTSQRTPLDPVNRERIELALRNSLRLLKLVNTLLDFSRIEAGRIEAVYEPTDLAQFTTDLAGVFRSAIERAELRLTVDCPPLPAPVYIDREMWEKIVLNLLSNALKFTFEGEITVSLHPNDNHQTILQIRDTGTGIAPKHLPHLFERFYQVRGAQARTHEGSGIGLALVYELVRLQGGAIAVSSTVGKGTCFTLTLPFGTAHLPSERIQPTRTLTSTAFSASPYVQETERWLPQEGNGEWEMGNGEEKSIPISHSLLPTPFPARVLIVDDNADMREYLTRILSEYVQVEAVADGTAALAAIQTQSPDLVLSDVMMPRLDGFGLLQTLRADPRTREIPVILLSARAGEEAIVEGLDAGADDYLIKPFSAQELVSRVNAHLQISSLRGEALHEARNAIRRKDKLLSVVSHELNTPLVSILGWTRLLRANPSNSAMLSTALDTIEHSATMQARLVQDLLDVSRITTGKLRLHLQPTKLESVIERAIATVTQLAAEAGIRLTWTGTTVAVVMGDRERLQQVVCNLLTNAIKFTPEGGRVEVELSLVKSHQLFAENEQLMTNDNYAEIRVTDTGIGITPDFLPHVFEPFRQAGGINSAKGLGLGLAIAHHIVELHKGTVQAQSAGEGQGATFTVRLPLLQKNDDFSEMQPGI